MNTQPLLTPVKAGIIKGRGQSVTEFAILGSLVILAFAFLISYSEKLNRQQYYLQKTFRAALNEARQANNSATYSKVVFNRMPNVSNPMELGQLQSFSSSANVLWSDGRDSRKEIGEDADGVKRYRDVLGPIKYQLNEADPIDIPQTETLHNLILDLEDAGVSAAIISGLQDIDTALREDDPDYEEQAASLSDHIAQLAAAGADPGIIEDLNLILASLSGGQEETSVNTFTNTVDATARISRSKPIGAGITTTRELTASDKMQAEITLNRTPYAFTHYLGKDGKYYPKQQDLTRSRSMQ
ncbi:MAG: hypothetical protein WC478_05290 [Candidatus Omnitrophota bacterium]